MRTTRSKASSASFSSGFNMLRMLNLLFSS